VYCLIVFYVFSWCFRLILDNEELQDFKFVFVALFSFLYVFLFGCCSQSTPPPRQLQTVTRSLTLGPHSSTNDRGGRRRPASHRIPQSGSKSPLGEAGLKVTRPMSSKLVDHSTDLGGTKASRKLVQTATPSMAGTLVSEPSAITSYLFPSRNVLTDLRNRFVCFFLKKFCFLVADPTHILQIHYLV
jgi:hypothetical protein